MVPGVTANSSSTTPSLTSPSSSSQDSASDVNRYTESPVPERSGSISVELRGDPQHDSTETENKQKMKDSKYKAIYYMNCRIGYRNSERIWSMKVLQQSFGETPRSQDNSSSSHELRMESRAKVEAGSGKNSLKTHFPKDPKCDTCTKTKITRSSCRRRAGTERNIWVT